jgi:glycosyltransferase involved in cell wall biosynthesis
MDISVIVPTFNRCGSLRRALASVMDQTHVPAEIIVIDDGSTDATASMLRAEFPEAVYCFQENNGVSAARNTGIRRATGQWLAFLDSDDEWLPEKLANQAAILMNNQAIQICHTEEIWIRHEKAR